MSKRKPGDLVEELDEMTDLDRKVFFEQAGLMCDTWDYTRGAILMLMFPSRTNRKHEANLDLCRNFVRNHGYLTRIHVLPDMPASTFRQCILKPLLEDGTVHDSGAKWKRDGKGQPHKVYRDKTRRYQKLVTEEVVRPVLSRSIVNEPSESARQFVSQVLTDERVLKVGFPKVPGFLANLKRLGYQDADQNTLIEWCKVVEQEIRAQSETNPALKVYKVHNGKISIKTNTGVMKND
tara:strand:+ start:11345 stop:12052 length:708 start_codon:yes stop_codon:yes gene_type:complete